MTKLIRIGDFDLMKIKKAGLVLFYGILLFMSCFFVSPTPAITNQAQSTELIFNSSNFSLVNLTNDSCYNGFIYSYNITSSTDSNYTWNIDISQTNGVYTYQYDSLNGTEQLLANTSRYNQIQYNFSLSGTYYVQVYWFTSTGQIVYYKEYTAENICGLQTNLQTNNFSYIYWWHWQLSDPSQYAVRQFNFSLDIYFYDQYNITFDYFFTLNRNTVNGPELINSIAGSKVMAGSGNTMQELTVSTNISNDNVGTYVANFQWKDLLVYDLANVNRSIIINFTSDPGTITGTGNTVTVTTTTPDYYSTNYEYYYNNDSGIQFNFLFRLLLLGGIGAFFIFAYNKRQRYNYQRGYRRSGYNPNMMQSPARGRQQITLGFCTNCGSRILANGQYCPNCGTKIE